MRVPRRESTKGGKSDKNHPLETEEVTSFEGQQQRSSYEQSTVCNMREGEAESTRAIF